MGIASISSFLSLDLPHIGPGSRFEVWNVTEMFPFSLTSFALSIELISFLSTISLCVSSKPPCSVIPEASVMGPWTVNSTPVSLLNLLTSSICCFVIVSSGAPRSINESSMIFWPGAILSETSLRIFAVRGSVETPMFFIAS